MDFQLVDGLEFDLPRSDVLVHRRETILEPALPPTPGRLVTP